MACSSLDYPLIRLSVVDVALTLPSKYFDDSKSNFAKSSRSCMSRPELALIRNRLASHPTSHAKGCSHTDKSREAGNGISGLCHSSRSELYVDMGFRWCKPRGMCSSNAINAVSSTPYSNARPAHQHAIYRSPDRRDFMLYSLPALRRLMPMLSMRTSVIIISSAFGQCPAHDPSGDQKETNIVLSK